MVWSEAIAAAFFLGMAFAKTPAWLIGLAFGSAIAELPFFSASRAAIPNLVESDDQISWANSLVTVGVHSGIAVGPVIGGVLLVRLGASWVFALNAVSFLISLGLTLSVRGSFQEDRSAHGAADDDHAGLAAGLAFLWRDRVLRRMSIAWFVFVLGMGMSMVADAPLAEHFGAGAVGFALLITCWGTGSVLGAATGRWMTPRSEPVWLVVGSFGIAVGGVAVGVAPVFPLVLVALLVMGTSDGFTMVAENGIMQRRTPDAVRSRTMAAFEAVLSIGLAIAYLIAGPVLRAFQVRPAGGLPDRRRVRVRGRAHARADPSAPAGRAGDRAGRRGAGAAALRLGRGARGGGGGRRSRPTRTSAPDGPGSSWFFRGPPG